MVDNKDDGQCSGENGINYILPINQKARQQIVEFLPTALTMAILSYQNFFNSFAHQKTQVNPTETSNKMAKDFGDHHGACRAAIAHIELLVKLAERMNIFSDLESVTEKEKILEIMQQAKIDYEVFKTEKKEGPL